MRPTSKITERARHFVVKKIVTYNLVSFIPNDRDITSPHPGKTCGDRQKNSSIALVNKNNTIWKSNFRILIIRFHCYFPFCNPNTVCTWPRCGQHKEFWIGYFEQWCKSGSALKHTWTLLGLQPITFCQYFKVTTCFRTVMKQGAFSY